MEIGEVSVYKRHLLPQNRYLHPRRVSLIPRLRIPDHFRAPAESPFQIIPVLQILMAASRRREKCQEMTFLLESVDSIILASLPLSSSREELMARLAQPAERPEGCQ